MLNNSIPPLIAPWVRCEDELPADSWLDPVLGLRDDGLRVLARYSGGAWLCKSFDNSPQYIANILAWMPLPDFPNDPGFPRKIS